MGATCPALREHGKWLQHSSEQQLPQSWFQVASVKRIVNSKHMHCHEASLPSQTLNSGPLLGWAWNITQNQGFLSRLQPGWGWIKAFLPPPFLRRALIGSLFSKYSLGLTFYGIKYTTYSHLSCQRPENKISHMGDLGTLFDYLRTEKSSLGIPLQKMYVHQASKRENA